MERINIKLNDPITLYCPILIGSISISSDKIDYLGEFTKFVLGGLAKGYSIKELIFVTELNEWVIREEIEYLLKIKFLIEDDNNYTLSDEGEKCFNLLKYVQTFNDAEHPIHINCYTGRIGDSRGKLISDSERKMEYQTFNIRIVKQLYQNKNPENALEYFLTSFNHDGLLEKDLDTLYVKIKYGKSYDYKEIILNQLPDINHGQDGLSGKESNSNIAFVRKIASAKITPKDSSIDNYRTVISTLKNLEEFDNKLLSSKSKKILKRVKKEQESRQLQHDIFIEKNQGTILDENEFKALFNKKDKVKIFKINLKNDFTIHNLDLTKDIKTFQLENKHIDDCTLEVREQEMSYLQIFNYYDYFD